MPGLSSAQRYLTRMPRVLVHRSLARVYLLLRDMRSVNRGIHVLTFPSLKHPQAPNNKYMVPTM